jgi:hypothetical protein
LLATALNVLLRLVPANVTAEIAATAISDATSAYSIAVTPLSFLMSRKTPRPQEPPCCGRRGDIVALFMFIFLNDHQSKISCRKLCRILEDKQANSW